ncbi:MAG: NADH-quinone oxidoreductase subunit H [Planctomycetes bacterium]|nr:NADH-quinone oxidoreductase subunit H [Planctomycetota bacterium]
MFEIEYNIVYANLLSLMFGYCIILTGFFSKNKYAFLGSVRTAVLMLNLEIFLGLLFINVIFLTESFSLTIFVLYQEYF